MRNPFSTSLAASLYAKGRPFYHPLIAELIRSALGKDFHVHRALDIACGTGLSTRILLEFTDSVTGCDDAKAMIDEAFLDPRITYHIAPATATAFEDGQFDLITLGSGLHWLDGDEFLREALRLLVTDGYLAIYDHGFSGEMACNPNYGCWHRNHYLPRFPSPPRAPSAIDRLAAEQLGLVGVFDSRFGHPWPMSSSDLVSYLLTQSNLLAVIGANAAALETARTWLELETAPYFRLPRESFRFVGTLSIWKKIRERSNLVRR